MSEEETKMWAIKFRQCGKTNMVIMAYAARMKELYPSIEDEYPATPEESLDSPK